MLMAEAFESLGLRGLGSVGPSLPNPGAVEKPRLEVLKKLDIIHCRRCMAALEEDSCKRVMYVHKNDHLSVRFGGYPNKK